MSDSNTLPDPTGANPRYQTANDTRYVYRASQEIEFPNGGVFVDTLTILNAADNSDALVKGTDWTYDDSCLDDYAASYARNADPTFSSVLVKKIIITSTSRPLPFRIACTYQNYWDVNRWVIPGSGDPLQFDPNMLSYLLGVAAKYTQQISGVQSTTAITTAEPTFYPEDIHEENASQFITDESYQANTTTGISLIQPRNGPFFRDTLVLKANGNTLVEGVDYQVDTLDKNRTKRSRNTSGIYWCVMLLTPQAGTILVSYHPVGGRITLEDMQTVWARVKDMTTFLNGLDVVTSDTLSLTPIMKTVFWRLDQQDEIMRRLQTNPNYGNATAGTSVQKVFTASDANLHWFDIATLYQTVSGGNVVTADCFKGRIFFPGLNVAWSFTVEANLNQGKKPFTFSTQSILVNPGVAINGDTDTATPAFPILRAVWNSLTSGVILQVGIANPNLTDNPIIEDMSTTESCWILDQTNPVIAGQAAPASTVVHDSGFTLPDGSSVWIGDNTSKSAVYVPPVDDGYVVYAGKSDYLKNLTNTTWTQNAVYLMEGIPLENYGTAMILLGDDNGNMYRAEIPLQAQAQANGTSTVTGTGLVYVDAASEDARLNLTFQKSTTAFTMAFALTGSVSADNTLSVRQVRINPSK